MSVATAHQISRYYDYYRDKEVVFTKANIRCLRADPRQIYLKCNGGQWPCIMNSSSLQMAKVLVGKNSGIFTEIRRKPGSSISIKYCFIDQDNQSVQFFVTSNVIDIKEFQGGNDLSIITLQFAQRPPDELIFRIGQFIEVNENFMIRKEERISINEKSLKNLGISKEESVIFIADVPRRCILKDLSFGGARVMLVGVPKFLVNKNVSIMLLFAETNEKLKIQGIIKHAEFLEGRKDIAVVHIAFFDEEVPMSYKFHINNYITSYQKTMIENQLKNEENMEKAEAAAAEKSEKRASLIAAATKKENEENAKKEAAKAEKAASDFMKSVMG